MKAFHLDFFVIQFCTIINPSIHSYHSLVTNFKIKRFVPVSVHFGNFQAVRSHDDESI